MFSERSKESRGENVKGLTMRIEYKLLENQKKGFILTREPSVVEDELCIIFSDAPVGATAIFENIDGAAQYRLLSDGACTVPAGFLRGAIHVVVTVLNGSESAPKYACESIYTKTVRGVVVVCPNGLDIPREIIDVCSLLQEIRNEIVALARRDEEIDEKFGKLLNGYNII